MKSAGFKLKAFSAVGDSTLPDNVRQFSFEPSLKAVKDREQQKNTSSAEQAFPESVLDITYRFTHPSSWSVSGSNGQLPISNAAGERSQTLTCSKSGALKALPCQLQWKRK